MGEMVVGLYVSGVGEVHSEAVVVVVAGGKQLWPALW